ncbi:MAG: hypothetical protein MPJ50_14070, partial [Pirellulales bacterium]|nr:hypothetical protein [Pirellulales bacterium]
MRKHAMKTNRIALRALWRLNKTGSLAMAFVLVGGLVLPADLCLAKVQQSAPDGFRLRIEQTTKVNADAAYSALANDIAKWWNPDHTYTGVAENLSLDLDQHCLREKLAGGGFVRHMEIVFLQPGKTVRMTGGLGPLQEMGVHGALQFSFEPSEGETRIILTYNVSGASFHELDRISPAVDAVLTEQLNR